MLTTPAGRWSKQERQRQGRERCHLRRLADRRIAGGERRRELPGQQQQRVVPRDDAGDHPDRLLDDERQLGRLDRGDDPPGPVAPDLGVVVERGGRPADLVGVLDQRLAALERHRPRRARRCARAGGVATSCSISPRSTAGVRSQSRFASRAAAIAASTCSSDGSADGRDRLLGGRVLDLERLAFAGDLLAADQVASSRAPPRRRCYGGDAAGGRGSRFERLRAMEAQRAGGDEWRVEVDLDDPRARLTLSERLHALDLDAEAARPARQPGGRQPRWAEAVPLRRLRGDRRRRPSGSPARWSSRDDLSAETVS